MKLLHFLFSLILKFVPVDESEFAKIKSEAELHYASIHYAEDDPETDKKKIGYWIKKYAETWYVKLLLAILYIFAVRWVSDFMNPKNVLDDDDE